MNKNDVYAILDEQRVEYLSWRWLFYVPLWVCFLYSLFVYCRIWRYMKSNKDLFIALGLFPVIMIICYIPTEVHRIYDWINEKPSQSLIVSDIIGSNIVSLMNSKGVDLCMIPARIRNE